MIVYGDWQRTEDTARLLASLAEDCAVLAGLGPGADRQRLATRLLVDAGELAQGVLDALFEGRGQDDWGPLQQLCADLTLEAARLWLACTQETVDVRPAGRVLEALSGCGLPGAVTVKVPE